MGTGQGPGQWEVREIPPSPEEVTESSEDEGDGTGLVNTPTPPAVQNQVSPGAGPTKTAEERTQVLPDEGLRMDEGEIQTTCCDEEDESLSVETARKTRDRSPTTGIGDEPLQPSGDEQETQPEDEPRDEKEEMALSRSLGKPSTPERRGMTPLLTPEEFNDIEVVTWEHAMPTELGEVEDKKADTESEGGDSLVTGPEQAEALTGEGENREEGPVVLDRPDPAE